MFSRILATLPRETRLPFGWESPKKRGKDREDGNLQIKGSKKKKWENQDENERFSAFYRLPSSLL